MKKDSYYGLEVYIEDIKQKFYYLAFRPQFESYDNQLYLEFFNGDRFMTQSVKKILNDSNDYVEFINGLDNKIKLIRFNKENWNTTSKIFFSQNKDVLQLDPQTDDDVDAFFNMLECNL